MHSQWWFCGWGSGAASHKRRVPDWGLSSSVCSRYVFVKSKVHVHIQYAKEGFEAMAVGAWMTPSFSGKAETLCSYQCASPINIGYFGMGCRPMTKATIKSIKAISGTLCLCDSGVDCNKAKCLKFGILDAGGAIRHGSWLGVVAMGNFLSILAKLQSSITMFWVSYWSLFVPIQYCSMKIDFWLWQ